MWTWLSFPTMYVSVYPFVSETYVETVICALCYQNTLVVNIKIKSHHYKSLQESSIERDDIKEPFTEVII